VLPPDYEMSVVEDGELEEKKGGGDVDGGVENEGYAAEEGDDSGSQKSDAQSANVV